MGAMLTTKAQRFWFVVGAIWAAFWLLGIFYAWLTNTDPDHHWYGFAVMWVLFGLAPGAIGWGLFAGVPATLRWIKAGK